MLIDLTTKVSSDNEVLKIVDSQQDRHKAMGHVGTHLDTYHKSKIPLEYFRSDGILIDVSDFCLAREIGLGDIENTPITNNSFVIFKTSQIDKYGYGTKDYFNDHPQLSHELIQFLIGKGIHFIGIDCSGIRRGNEHKDADKICEENGVYVIENLSNLDSITNPFTVYTMWLDDDELTGLKCKVIIEQ